MYQSFPMSVCYILIGIKESIEYLRFAFVKSITIPELIKVVINMAVIIALVLLDKLSNLTKSIIW